MIICTTVALVITTVVISQLIITRHHRQFTVHPGFIGLLHHDRKPTQVLNPGRHARWGRGYHLAMLDMRRTVIQLESPELSTSDNLLVKIELVLTVQITDPTKWLLGTDDFITHIHTLTQSTLRALIPTQSLNNLQSHPDTFTNHLQSLLNHDTTPIGLHFHAIKLRDVIHSEKLVSFGLF